MKVKLLFVGLLIMLASASNAQYSLASGNKTLQISGYFLPVANFRFTGPNETDHAKNKMNLDFAVIEFDGMVKKNIHWDLQLNLAALSGSTNVSDELLMQSTVEYRTRKDNFNVRAGYDKIPFMRSSIQGLIQTPWLQRPEMARGKSFNRRDLGVTVEKNFLNKRLNLYAGVYTGMGSASINGDNDMSGHFLYVGRGEFSWPARMRYSEFDVHHTSLPNFSVGGNLSYAQKDTTTFIDNDYPFLTQKGKKLGYGGDVTFMYKGFVFVFEGVIFRMTPTSLSDPQLYGKTDYFKAMGQMAQLNYTFRKLRSVIGVRYDVFDANDIIKGNDLTTIGFAYNYLIDGTNSCIKIHYFKRIKAEGAVSVPDDQIRIGWQYSF